MLSWLPEVWEFILFTVLAIAPIVFFSWYVIIIKRRNGVQEAFGTIDVQLRERLDLIPNILKLAKRFMTHETTLISDIVKLRQQVNDSTDVNTKLAADNKLSDKMGQLMVQVENYPELKSDATMINAMNTFSEVEARIAASRRFHNSAATSLNNAIQIFPGNIIASIAGVSVAQNYQVEEKARKSINVDDYLGEGNA